VPIKSWTCPGCARPFIVDADAARDTCPWCHATVEQFENDLKVVTEPVKTPESTVPPEPEPTTAASGGPQAWWPFEFSS
jgi:hypothetical protein